ncbi:MAG TPA: hypothetical protein PK711_13610 [Bacteroidales bacterium]|nr:hypothetical protein [Bacteroidales bacterium]HRZ20907.1 hypothetical protein [Bacteroidales bacterium]
MKGIGNRQNKMQPGRVKKSSFSGPVKGKGTSSPAYASQVKQIRPANKRMQGSK